MVFQVWTLLAGPIPGLFNTGVKDDGTDATLGGAELHYVSLTGSPLDSVFVLSNPAGPWVANSAASQWIGPDTGDGSSIAGGNYSVVYRLSFDLTGFDPSSASISGQWATDNSGLDILINGNSTGNTSSGFSAFTPFSISSGFVAGVNHLDFSWSNSGGPGGLRVELSGTANTVSTGAPEPASFALLSLGLAGLGLIGTRRFRHKPE